MSEEGFMGESFIGRIIRGILKLVLGGFIITAVSGINIPDLEIGNTTLSGVMFKAIIQFAIPLALIFSALRDFGVEL